MLAVTACRSLASNSMQTFASLSFSMERHGARSSLKVRPVAAEAQWEAEAEREAEAEWEAMVAAEAREAVREAVVEWEVAAECREWEAEVAARDAAAQEAAIATPDDRVASGQSKVFDPGKP